MGRQRSKRIYPIFIPFSGCRFRCAFCNQWASSGVPQEDVMKLLEDAFSFLKSSERVYDEVSIYGGTPLWSGLGWQIMERLTPFIKEGKVGGIRLSTRPDSITPETVNRLKELGVTTVEIGIQSLSDRVLRCVNRGHTVADVERAISLLKGAGINVIGQFMIGLPCEGDEIYDIPKFAADRGLGGVRIFPLVVLKDTELEKWYREGRYKPLSVDDAVYKLGMIVRDLERRGVPVIQIGLHSSKELERAVVAGPYVGNLGEMVRSFIAYMDVIEGKRSLEDVPVSQRRMFDRWRRLVEDGNTG